MADFDELRRDAIKRAVQAHKTVDDAHVAAYEEIRQLPGFAAWAADLSQRVVRDEIHAERHACNRAGKRAVSNEPRGNVPGNQAAVENLLTLQTYRIGGTVLGLLTGAQLRNLMDDERRRAEGHMKNVYVMEELSPLVGDDEVVGNKVKERFFQKILQKVFCKEQALAG